MSADDPTTAVSTLPSPPEGCPPPLRCRQVAENWHAVAEAWTLPGSRFGTTGTVGGTGTPIYFLNAFGGCAELYTLTAWLLRDYARCVLIDWSSPSCATADTTVAQKNQRFTLSDFADDIAAVADHLGDQTFAVYGAIVGAAVAARLAARRPERVSHLVLQGAWDRRRLSLGERGLAWWHSRSEKPLSSWSQRELFQTANHQIWFPPQDPDRWAWFLELTGTIPLALMAAEARAIDGVDLTDDLARLACPTRIVATEGAGLRSVAVQQQLATLSPALRYEYLHSTGQHPYLTHPHRMVKLLKSHLNGETETAEGCCSEPAAAPSCCSAEETPP
jgi:pimeloyl-ACP methyl ester carboxylesterase